MNIAKQFRKMLLLSGIAFSLAACAPVGSERWCGRMDAKPAGEWTAQEAGDYAKYCVLGLDPE